MVNTWAAILFGSANAENQKRMFFYAGLVIIFSGFFDLVDGQVARATNRVTRFGAFFDSVVDRYSDASQYLGLLVFYARGGRFFWVVLAAFVMVSAIMVSYTRARAESLIGSCRVGFMERPERSGAGDPGSAVQPHGARAVGDRGAEHDHGNPPHALHLDPNAGPAGSVEPWAGRVEQECREGRLRPSKRAK